MEEIKIKGIVLNSRDYKDKDKLVEIFSLELGKIFASLKGCKSPSSKLKFAYQPFCFAEFILSKQKDNYVIINATLLDSFYEITTSPTAFINGSLILELTSLSSFGEDTYYKTFVNILSALKGICYDNIMPEIVTIKFCLSLLQQIGYSLNFSGCNNCKMQFNNDIFLDLDSGEFLCNNCKTQNADKITKVAYNNMRIIDNTNFDKLNTLRLKDNIGREILILLINNFEFRFSTQIKTKKFI